MAVSYNKACNFKCYDTCIKSIVLIYISIIFTISTKGGVSERIYYDFNTCTLPPWNTASCAEAFLCYIHKKMGNLCQILDDTCSVCGFGCQS